VLSTFKIMEAASSETRNQSYREVDAVSYAQREQSGSLVCVMRASGERTARRQGQPRRSKRDPAVRFPGRSVEQTPDVTVIEMQKQRTAERGIKASVGTIWTFSTAAA
jgi:hypothetical protein